MPRKSKLDTLKGNVEAQERRLQEAFNTFEVAKSHTTAEQTATLSQEADSSQSSWDMLEKIIGLEGDLLTSYREYTKELEKRARKEEKNKPLTEIPDTQESVESAQATQPTA